MAGKNFANNDVYNVSPAPSFWSFLGSALPGMLSPVAGNIANYFLTRAQNNQMYQREDNAVQRRMQDIANAGVNPLLAINGSVSSASSNMGAIAQFQGLGDTQSPYLNYLAQKNAVHEQKVHAKELDVAERELTLKRDNLEETKRQWNDMAFERIGKANTYKLNAKGSPYESLYGNLPSGLEGALYKALSWLIGDGNPFGNGSDSSPEPNTIGSSLADGSFTDSDGVPLITNWKGDLVPDPSYKDSLKFSNDWYDLNQKNNASDLDYIRHIREMLARKSLRMDKKGDNGYAIKDWQGNIKYEYSSTNKEKLFKRLMLHAHYLINN